MAFFPAVIHSLDYASLSDHGRSVVECLGDQSVLAADLDNTLFPRGSVALYPDADRLLKAAQYSTVLLVTANPDTSLLEARQHAIADVTSGDVLAIAPRRAHWMKYGLYAQALRPVRLDQTVAVLGDRWCMDVQSGLFAARHAGLMAVGACLRRTGTAGDTAFDRACKPVEAFVASGLRDTAVGRALGVR